MKRFAFLALLALPACATISASPATTGTPTAALNQTANVGPHLVKPIAVVEDSRCPALVRCVWAGRVVLRTLTNAGAGADVLDLTLGEPHSLGGGRLTLVNVEPPKVAPGTTNPRAYRFTFTFVRP